MSTSSGPSWLHERAAGILLHPTSLHGGQGIGVLGAEARQFLSFLREAGIYYWQMLPLGPTGFGDSPYSTFSAFAGNPYLIDECPLLENGLLQEAECQHLRELPQHRVDFGKLYHLKWPLLRLAHKRFHEQKRSYLPNYGLFSEFRQQEAQWLEPFCAFMALKERFGGEFWGNWPMECRTLADAKASSFWEETRAAQEAHAFFQYVFFGQWSQLKEAAHAEGIAIIGDAPIFVALDSADVWASPQWFEMSNPGAPDVVAGVPPDDFSATGQLWGNPLYDWNALKEDGYRWWIERLRSNFRLFDVVRLDHFRGFYDYWRIPAEATDAREGEWADGPRQDFFNALFRELPEAQLIAEDLGMIDQRVRRFRDELGLPGMEILQFAFGGSPDNLYLPHHHNKNAVVYPGTHDNDTSRGWYESAPPESKDQFRRYFRVDGSDPAWDLIRASYGSVSRMAVLPAQDLLGLGSEARMNRPGEAQGNWHWRLTSDQFSRIAACASYLRELGFLFDRG